MTDNSIKICFVAPGVYALLTGKDIKRVIGTDVHQVILAKELINHDFRVSFVTYDEERRSIEYIYTMEIIKIHNATYSLKILNIILKAFRIWRAMRKAKAHIYFQHGGVIGVVSLFCRLMKKKFVYHIGSDALVNKNLITRKNKEFSRSKFSIGTFGNWLDIKLADAIIVQSKYQKRMLKKNFDKDGVLIKKPILLTKQEVPKKVKPPIVLWVGAMAEVKQPEMFVRLAEAIPEGRFQMIGGHSGDKELYDKIEKSSKKISNFEFLGVISFNEINEYFGQASILVNTSMFEAYPPYAAIQAWMNYVPVVSLGDNSDEIMCRYEMGFHSKTFDQLVKDVKTLLKNERLREEFGMNGRNYVEREHDITEITNKYIEVFKHVGRC